MDWFAAPDYWFARMVLERGLGLVYLLAFANALHQFPALLGERGLLPVPRFLAKTSFWESPSLFHLGYSDRALRLVGWTGVVLAAATVVAVLSLLVASAGTVLAGGWADVKPDAGTLDQPPVEGLPTEIGFTILQHGETPAGWVTPTVRLTDLASGETIEVGAPPGDDTVGVGPLLDAAVERPVAGQHVELVERARVEQVLETLAGEELALLVLALHRPLRARVDRFLLAPLEILEPLLHRMLSHIECAGYLP